MIQEIENWARQQDVKTLRLSVAQGNEAAEKLYLRCGFADTGVPGDLMPDGVRHERVMAKPLG